MAGADRVEGCLFGNGERTGNVDLVTLAMNLYTQGVSPNIDFSDLNRVIGIVEVCNKIPVGPRAPYGGSLVVCAFSGSHQDAIKKGFQVREKEAKGYEDYWQVPYLPLDPKDIGRDYQAVIRVNSQSGKGGAAWIIQQYLHLDLPRGLQVEFSRVVQKWADERGRELLPVEITELFEKTYFLRENHPRFTIVDYNITPDRSRSPAPPAPGRTADTKNLARVFEGVIAVDGKEYSLRGRGNGPLSSLANALREVGVDIEVANYIEHSVGKGSDVKAASYIECTTPHSQQKVWGVGIHEDVAQSSLIALLSAASNVSGLFLSPPRRSSSICKFNSCLYNHGELIWRSTVCDEPTNEPDLRQAHPQAVPEPGAGPERLGQAPQGERRRGERHRHHQPPGGVGR